MLYFIQKHFNKIKLNKTQSVAKRYDHVYRKNPGITDPGGNIQKKRLQYDRHIRPPQNREINLDPGVLKRKKGGFLYRNQSGREEESGSILETGHGCT